MIELAETLQAPVQVGTNGSWQKFPSWHPLYGNGGRGYTPDVLLGLEVGEMSNQARTARESGRKTISISSELLFQHSNIHDYGHYADVDLAIAADAEATLPSLIEEIRRLVTPERRAAMQARGARVAAAHKEAQLKAVEDAPVRLGRQPDQRPPDDRRSSATKSRTTTGRSSRATSSPATGSGGC